MKGRADPCRVDTWGVGQKQAELPRCLKMKPPQQNLWVPWTQAHGKPHVGKAISPQGWHQEFGPQFRHAREERASIPPVDANRRAAMDSRLRGNDDRCEGSESHPDDSDTHFALDSITTGLQFVVWRVYLRGTLLRLLEDSSDTQGEDSAVDC
jgi:hypothetical protein